MKFEDDMLGSSKTMLKSYRNQRQDKRCSIKTCRIKRRKGDIASEEDNQGNKTSQARGNMPQHRKARGIEEEDQTA